MPSKNEYYVDQDILDLQCRKISEKSYDFLLEKSIFWTLKSGKKSKIACRCKADFGGFSLFVGCKWNLVESDCPSVLFSLATDSADFDDSFNSFTFTGDSSEEIDTTSEPTVTTQGRILTFSQNGI